MHDPSPGRRIRAMATLAAAAALAGCASTRGLEPALRPMDADRVAASRSLSDFRLSDAAFPRQDWWTRLGDPQLDALVAEALRGNPSLDAADARVREARAQAGLADAERKPGVDATAQYAAAQLPKGLAGDEIGGTLIHSVVLNLGFSWSPDLWGGRRAAWEAAVDQAHAAEIDAQAARLALSSDVAHAYIDLAQAWEALDVAERERQRAGHLLDLGRQRVEAGLDNDLQLRNAEAAIAGARQQAQAARQQIDALRNALAALLGQGPDRGLDIARPRLLQAPALAVPAVLPSELLGHRADVVAARWRVEAAGRGIAARKAAFKPSIDLSALVGLGAANVSDLFDTDAVLGFGGPALSLPVFDGGRLRARLSAADAQYDQAVAVYHQSLATALREVVDALQAARSLDAQLASVDEARRAAAAAFDLATQRYRAGLGTQLDVLAAQRPLLQYEQQTTALRARRHAASVDLDRALGGGLPVAAPASPSIAPDIAKASAP